MSLQSFLELHPYLSLLRPLLTFGNLLLAQESRIEKQINITIQQILTLLCLLNAACKPNSSSFTLVFPKSIDFFQRYAWEQFRQGPRSLGTFAVI